MNLVLLIPLALAAVGAAIAPSPEVSCRHLTTKAEKRAVPEYLKTL